jgi:hypothetical protein
MKTIFLIILITIFSFSAQAQSSLIKSEAQKMASAYVSGNFDLVVKHTYPKFVKSYGGEKGMATNLTDAKEILKKNGIFFEKTTVGEVGKIYVAGNEKHCVVPQKTILKNKKGRFEVLNYLLAVSMDNGKKWFFVDCNVGKERLLSLFPDFNNDMVIPEATSIKLN